MAAIDLYLLFNWYDFFDTMAIANETIIANRKTLFNGLTAMMSAVSFKSTRVVVIHVFSGILESI